MGSEGSTNVVNEIAEYMDEDIQTVIIHYLIRQDYQIYVKERQASKKSTEMD